MMASRIWLKDGAGSDVLVLPGAVIDRLLSAVSMEGVCVYLYAARRLQKDSGIDLEEMKDSLCLSMEEVQSALQVLEESGLVKVSCGRDGMAEGIILLNAGKAGAPSGARRLPKVSKEEVEEVLKDKEFSIYIIAWNQYFEETLSHDMVCRIAEWYIRFDRNLRLIDYLMEYCTARGHGFDTVMDVAADWYRKGYVSVGDVEDGEGLSRP